jgi:hypothetical protein
MFQREYLNVFVKAVSEEVIIKIPYKLLMTLRKPSQIVYYTTFHRQVSNCQYFDTFLSKMKGNLRYMFTTYTTVHCLGFNSKKRSMPDFLNTHFYSH